MCRVVALLLSTAATSLDQTAARAFAPCTTSHLFCWLYTARVASPPVATPASHACLQTDSGSTSEGQRCVFLRRRLQPIAPPLDNEANLGRASYTSEIFSQQYHIYGNCPLLKYSLGRRHRPLVPKRFLISHQPALFAVFL